VGLQLGDVLAGLAVRRGKPERYRLVDLVLAVAHGNKHRLARDRGLAGERR
jgi:hypothetical protein